MHPTASLTGWNANLESFDPANRPIGGRSFHLNEDLYYANLKIQATILGLQNGSIPLTKPFPTLF
ncbi:hypothetical protein [Leptothermofonsia sp. ETS-13]|uniref:hypothetical protein n=1 Tax=Leptothermofonsia sp. ETS-13 TaxID=3035696 RepID=UPI003BA2DDD9